MFALFPTCPAASVLIATPPANTLEALLKFMPRNEAEAMTQAELFEKAVIPTKTTGQKALRHLLEMGQIQRIGEGWQGKPFRYFLATPNYDAPERPTRFYPPVR